MRAALLCAQGDLCPFWNVLLLLIKELTHESQPRATDDRLML